MFSKFATKVVLAIASIEIALLLGALSPTARAQQSEPATSVSVESISTGRELSRQAQLKVEEQNFRGAISDISKAIQLDPQEADFYYQRGLILSKLSDRQAAVRDFDSAILRDPNHAWAYLHRAGMSFNFNSSYQLNDYRGFNYNIMQVIDYRRGDASAILDLRTARDLFARQGDTQGHQIADRLIQHFTGNSVSE